MRQRLRGLLQCVSRRCHADPLIFLIQTIHIAVYAMRSQIRLMTAFNFLTQQALRPSDQYHGHKDVYENGF